MQTNQFLTHTLSAAPWGNQVASILSAAINAVDPYQAVKKHINLFPPNLHLDRMTFPLKRYRRVFLVGAGKAGLPMTKAVIDQLGNLVTDGIVIVKEGHTDVDHVGPVRILEAGHPIPDERGVQATQELLKLLTQATTGDLVIVVISGGGSALLTAPVAGITLEDMRKMTDALLNCGADISEVNTLRKRVDSVKGGGLARAVAPASVASLILSDVVGDPLDLIASGPTVPQQDRWQDGMEIVRKYRLQAKLPPNLLKILHQPPLPPPILTHPPMNILVGNNQIAAQAALDQAHSLGYATELIGTSLVGEARQVGIDLAERLKSMISQPRPALGVAGGETTVTITGDGLGGRNQELALAAVPILAGLERVALVTLATDGGDGPTDAAGAVVTGETLARAKEKGLDPADFLARNDSYTFFSALGDCLKPRPTRTNVNDLTFLFTF